MTRTATTLLKCPKCQASEMPGTPKRGPYATGLTNTRTYEGTKHSVADVVCGACSHSWLSRTKRAHLLAKQAQRDDRTPGGGTGDVVLGTRTEGDA